MTKIVFDFVFNHNRDLALASWNAEAEILGNVLEAHFNGLC
jgi:hypothetical protein|tara:strand:+ start:203 stop:325 length:123 start_codon:yes stop_codon:yes gene_type:complete